jgi:hypothetical protein
MKLNKPKLGLRNPDIENDLKNTLFQLAKRSSKRNIREDIAPINKNAASENIQPNHRWVL